MNSEEFTSLAKMSVIAIIVALVVGATFTLWYIVSDPMNDYRDKTEKTMASANMDRLYELQDASIKSNAAGSETPPPLVSNVVSVLSEFKPDELLYIYVDRLELDAPTNTYTTKDARVYTYTNVVSSELNIVTNGTLSGTITPTTSSVPINLCCKYLLENSKYRCDIEIKPDVSYQGVEFLALHIHILPDEGVY